MKGRSLSHNVSPADNKQIRGNQFMAAYLPVTDSFLSDL
ncbi:hypothetical protein [Morganella morganii IS15]|nr:hypothetical protein CSB69_3107 [Morganella morganii]EMP53459.1 hypothetical protein C790_01650 [Morganella morganii SC01]CDK63701.1 hypothetical protein [Morganella morganii IS15]